MMDKFFFGADYYPEYWPRERWEEDARLMREAGFNVVRLAEFAWARFEPQEGIVDFQWLDEILDILAAHGIKAVLGTPTASIPPWLAEKHPDIFRVDEWQRQVTYGNRQQCCINSIDFRIAGKRIIRQIAERYAKSDAVIGWQVDNELGPRCYCERCQQFFHLWLKHRYHELDALNEAWGTGFWSHHYSSWSQIPLPWATAGAPNPGLALDYRRFMADSYADFADDQIAILRELSPGKFITHNFMGFRVEELDYVAIAAKLDFASWDNYPNSLQPDPADIAIGHAVTRGLKSGKNFWVMEQQSGPAGWGQQGPTPRPGQIRLWTYQSIAHGADGIVYFRWRPARHGTEQYWHGILNHDGSTNRRYQEVVKIGKELSRISHLIPETNVRAQVALINDYPSRWAFQIQPTNPAMSYVGQALAYYRAFRRLGIMVDVVPALADLSGYRVVVAPSLFVMTSEIAKHLEEYVEDGGTLIATFRTAVKDQYNAIFNEPLPGMLTHLFGIKVIDYHSPPLDDENNIEVREGVLSSGCYPVKAWMDILKPEGADILAHYAGGYAAGEPAVAVNRRGGGMAVYIGTWPDQPFIEQFAQWLSAEREIERFPVPDGVESAVRYNREGSPLLFLMNHTAEPRCSELGGGRWRNLLSGEQVKKVVELEPYDVAVLIQST